MTLSHSLNTVYVLTLNNILIFYMVYKFVFSMAFNMVLSDRFVSEIPVNKFSFSLI